ncbi:cupin domain-containing protein [uncultured Shewanella sp.]|uniref:cupin domain-containing protein n=1 Tax=uncultured Shewanella sp. TaxID=173975 RepID=UPI00260F882A|nr:cupin domain-containing protein [uncultured Shewanella sp.]
MRSSFTVLNIFILLLTLNINLAQAKQTSTENKASSNEPELDITLLNRTDKSWDGKRLPSYPSGQPQITVLKIVIPPKGKFPIHKHPFITVATILKGEITLYLEDGSQQLRLTSGDVDTEVVNNWHYATNEGTVPTDIIVFYAGIKGMPVLIKK